MSEETVKRSRYTLARTSARPFPVEQHPHLFIAVLILTWSLWIVYFASEIFLACRPSRSQHQSTKHVCMAVAAEFVLTFQELVLALGLLIGLASSRSQVPRPSYDLIGQSAPTIDILVTCCGEDVDVILDTVTAAAAQDYPSGCYRVLVLDDGHDDELRRRLANLKPWLKERDLASVEYLSRHVKKGTRSFFKAGNLNHGINVDSEGRHPSEYFAGLDCDMITGPDWLRKCIGHMILHDKIGMVVSPQKYYNVPPGDPLGQQADFSMYFTVQEVLNDASSACMCTGTGYIARRKAIQSIGGWPLAESGEDYMCSALLSDAGWEIAFVRENLQYGICPGSMRALLKQRMRWTDAGIEVHKFLRFYVGHSALTAQMTLAQRAVNILYMLRDYAPLALVVALALLPYALRSDTITKTSSADHQELEPSLPIHKYLLLATWLSNKVCYLAFYNRIGLSRVWYFQSNEIWAAPYMAYRCLLSFLPSHLNSPSFFVCGSIPSSERSLHSRPSFLARLLNINTLLWITLAIYLSFPLTQPLLSNRKPHSSLSLDLHPSTEAKIAVWLLPGPLLKLVGVVLKMLVPVRYMLFPPAMPARDHMLAADERGVKRVKKEWKESGEKKGEWGIWVLVAGIEMICYLIICGFV
ncbi:MAG: hypothetical protein Q9215_002827 [Flavoplaca cf. flavocitrina]